jgi:hypothetical protein
MFMAATSSDEEDRQVVTALVKKLAISRKSLQHLKNRFAYTMHITITTALRHKRVHESAIIMNHQNDAFSTIHMRTLS